MKKNIIKSFVIIGLILFTAACNNVTEDAIFSESASQRIETTINEYSTLLESSENGWVLEYYPEANQIYGGYNFVIKFDTGEVSVVSSELEAPSATESSTYDIISYGGPVLTFNTYNTFLHTFSTPSAQNYQAQQGDYEFTLMSKDENTIIVKGVKSGNIMKLIKLTETPEVYLTKVKDINDYFLGTSGVINISGNDYAVNLTNRHLAFSITDEDSVNEAYVFTDKGIKLYTSITIDGNEVSEFILDKTENKLTSLNGEIVIDLLKTPFNLVQNWTINTLSQSDMSSSFFSNYVDIYNANVAAWNEVLSRTITFGNTTINGNTTPGIMFLSSNVYRAQYNLAFSGLLGQPDQLNITKVGGAFNWRFYTHLEPMVDFIVNNAPYKAELNNTVNPTEVKLTSTVDSSVWFVIRQ